MKLTSTTLFLLFISAIYLFSCKKTDQDLGGNVPIPTKDNAANKVRNWFEWKTSQDLKLDARGIVGSDWRTGNPVWEKTQAYAASGSYITPIGYYGYDYNQDRILYKFLLTEQNSEGNIASGFYIFLIVRKEVLLSDSFQISEKLITPELLKYSTFPLGFEADIVRYNINFTEESYSVSMRTQMGNPNSAVKLKYKSNGVFYDFSENSFQSLNLECGQCVDWYEEVYNPETGQIYSETYLYTECGLCDDIPSGPTTGGGGGGSGNGGPQTNPPPCPLAPAGISIIGRLPLETEPPLENDDPCGPPELEDDGEIACPNNFQFVAVTTHSLWQEAKVTSVYVRLGYIGQAGYSFINVQIPALYLGLPYHNQNGGIMYTNMEARQITAAAFNFAEVDLRMHFRNFPHLTANQLKTYWISRIDLYIKAATWGAGKAGTTGSANPINPVQGVPYDPIPGNGGPC